MKTNEIIQLNNQLRKQLNPENNKYYTELLVYIRLRSFSVNEHDGESMLLNILQDIIDAQNDGISAKTYFGENPQMVGNRILKENNISIMTTVKGALYYLSIFLFMFLLPSVVNYNKPIDVGTILITVVTGVILFFITSRILIIKKISTIASMLHISTLLIEMAIIVFPTIILLTHIHTYLIFRLTGMTGITILSMCLLGYLIYFFIFKRNKTAVNWSIFSLIFIILIFAIYTRTIQGSYLIDTKSGQSLSTNITIAILVIWSVINMIFAFISSKRD
ncbi:hypothetical protein ACQW5G_02460 [Fructilactobacillus sp. Tb1]|uniref:hypothetical protein n=1 Tax=Fructilactobacillus sp. Tb1 TaxID=3422304 RepID=UPI003D2C5A00